MYNLFWFYPQVQRLKDEARDLKQELKIRDRRDIPDCENKKNLELTRTPIDCTKLIKFETQTPPPGKIIMLYFK